MGSVNKVILVGNLGKDAEVRVTPGGQSVASFSIATTENWTSKEGEKKEQTEWHRIVLWGKPADSLQPYLVKGKQIYLEGRLQTRQWEKEGQKHYTTEVKADKIVLLGGGGRGGDRQAGSRRQRRLPGPDGERRPRHRRRHSVLAKVQPFRTIPDPRAGRHRPSRGSTLRTHPYLRSPSCDAPSAACTCTASPGPISVPTSLPSIFPLEQHLARPHEDRLVLLVVVLQAEGVALVDVDLLADVAIGACPPHFVSPRFLDAMQRLAQDDGLL